MVTPRKAESESEMYLHQELVNSRLLHDISNELISEQNIDALYAKIIDAAARLMRSRYASMQMLHQEQDGALELQLLGHRGSFRRRWNSGIVCGSIRRAAAALP